MEKLRISFKEIPATWSFCFCDGCARHDECLHYVSGKYLPDKVTEGYAIFPTAFKTGTCKHFKEVRVIHAAYGFAPLFKEVKHKDYTLLRDKIKRYLGSHTTYYRYNSGEHKLTPEQQQWILDLFARYGYTENLTFEHYQDIVDFSE